MIGDQFFSTTGRAIFIHYALLFDGEKQDAKLLPAAGRFFETSKSSLLLYSLENSHIAPCQVPQ